MAGTSDPPPFDAGGDPDGRTLPEPATAFAGTYVDAVGRYAASPSEAGLQEAYELGRNCLRAGTSLLELVDAHREVQHRSDGRRSAGQDAADRFFVEALAAFELAQRGYADAQQAAHTERGRAELARGLTRAYLAAAAPNTVRARSDAAAGQIRTLLGAAEARVEFGPEPPTPAAPHGPVLEANLPDGTGRLVAVGAPGRSWTDADQANLDQLAVVVHGPITDARRLEFAERLERLGALLGAEAGPDTIIDRVLADGLDHAAASSGAVLLPADGRLRVAGARTAGPWAVGDLVELDKGSTIAQAATTATTLFGAEDADLGRGAEAAAAAGPGTGAGPDGAGAGDGDGDGGGGADGVGPNRGSPDHAWALVPLRYRTGPAGVFAMRFDQPQPFDPAQRSFLTQAGERVAAALERGQLYANERAARQAAERATERVAQLHELANDLSHAATRRNVATVLARYTTTTTGAPYGVVAGRGSDTDDVELLAVIGLDGGPPHLAPAELSQLARAAASADEPTTAALAEAAIPGIVGDRLRDEGVGSVGIYPLIAGSRRVGGVFLGWPQAHPPGFDPDALAGALAVAGPALQRAGRYDTDHEIAVTLQRSLLTDADITIPGIDWSAQYRSGSPGVAGGDWYDVIALADDAVALAIGDIVGKGVEAAAAMGQLRSATRALAQRIRDPAELLHALDDYANTTKQGLYSSMVFAVFDPSVGALHHAVAGHPPPVLRTADGDVMVVGSGRGSLLGIDATRTTATLPMGTGDTLVLFTDGLIERRHRTLQEGLTQLCNVIGAGPSDPALLSRYILHAMNDGKATDDIAVVSAQLTPIRARSPAGGDPDRTSVGS